MDLLALGRTLDAGLLVAAEDQTLFLGEDFLPWMVLAFGAALVAGNALALLRPPSPDAAARRGRPASTTDEGAAPERPPLARTLVMIVVGLIAAGWGLASLLA